MVLNKSGVATLLLDAVKRASKKRPWGYAHPIKAHSAFKS